MQQAQFTGPKYDANKLLNTLITRLGLKNDAALSDVLDIAPPVISKIRHSKLPVGSSLLIRMHEVSGMPIQELRGLMGDARERFGASTRELLAA